MTDHKVTVIVPAYNAETTIVRCLDSIRNQTYSNLEIIVVNDGSTDKTAEICKKVATDDNRIICINKDNGGVSSARNAGLDASTGDYIAFVDSDDYIDADHIQNMSMIIDEYEADIAIAGIALHYADNQVENQRFDYVGLVDKITFKSDIKKYLGTTVLNSLSNKLYKATARDIKLNENAVCGEDFEFNIEYMRNIGNYAFSNACTYHYIVPEYNFDYKYMDGQDYSFKYQKLVYDFLIDDLGKNLTEEIYYTFFLDILRNSVYATCTVHDLKIAIIKLKELRENNEVRVSLNQWLCVASRKTRTYLILFKYRQYFLLYIGSKLLRKILAMVRN